MDSQYCHLPSRLREERERRNLAQRLLCRHMHIQQSHFRKAETGQRRFSYRALEGYAPPISMSSMLSQGKGQKPVRNS